MSQSKAYLDKQLSMLQKEIEMIQEKCTGEEREELLLGEKKSLERLLYLYVIDGCGEDKHVWDSFPELRSQYDTESEKLLDQKIKVLSEIIKRGPDCDYKKIDGFDDILEKKPPDGQKEISFF